MLFRGSNLALFATVQAIGAILVLACVISLLTQQPASGGGGGLPTPTPAPTPPVNESGFVGEPSYQDFYYLQTNLDAYPYNGAGGLAPNSSFIAGAFYLTGFSRASELSDGLAYLQRWPLETLEKDLEVELQGFVAPSDDIFYISPVVAIPGDDDHGMLAITVNEVGGSMEVFRITLATLEVDNTYTPLSLPNDVVSGGTFYPLSNCMKFDDAGNLYVVTMTPPTVSIQKFTSAGAVVAAFGTAGVVQFDVTEFALWANASLASIASEPASIYLIAYFGANDAEKMAIAKFNMTTGALDTAFGNSSTDGAFITQTRMWYTVPDVDSTSFYIANGIDLVASYSDLTSPSMLKVNGTTGLPDLTFGSGGISTVYDFPISALPRRFGYHIGSAFYMGDAVIQTYFFIDFPQISFLPIGYLVSYNSTTGAVNFVYQLPVFAGSTIAAMGFGGAKFNDSSELWITCRVYGAPGTSLNYPAFAQFYRLCDFQTSPS